MSKIDDGGHAYPVCFEGGKNSGEQPYFHEGMSLRDWFAGNVAANHMQLNEHNVNDYQAQTTARWAYMVADAMIAARKAGA